MGFCNGYQAPGFMNAGGFGRGGGRGRGFRGRFPAGGPYWQGYAGYGPYEQADQKAFLDQYIFNLPAAPALRLCREKGACWPICCRK